MNEGNFAEVYEAAESGCEWLSWDISCCQGFSASPEAQKKKQLKSVLELRDRCHTVVDSFV